MQRRWFLFHVDYYNLELFVHKVFVFLILLLVFLQADTVFRFNAWVLQLESRFKTGRLGTAEVLGSLGCEILLVRHRSVPRKGSTKLLKAYSVSLLATT